MGKVDPRYFKTIEAIFFDNYKPGDNSVAFTTRELRERPDTLGFERLSNPPDIVATFRSREELPKSIRDAAPSGKVWVIAGAGRGHYCFELIDAGTEDIRPTPGMAEIKIPDATPELINMYAFKAEQSLLAKVRYNRLVDIFTGITCYSLQSHLQTSVPKRGQVESDEVYLGLDASGAHYVFPMEAKGGKDKISVIQIENGLALCQTRFPNAICRPLAAQFIDDVIALFEFKPKPGASRPYEVVRNGETHFRLVPKDQLSDAELHSYREDAIRKGNH